MNKLLLAVDIGNSTIGMALYPDTADGKQFFIRKIESSSDKSSALTKSIFSAIQELFSQAGKRISDKKKIGVIISSVVPKVNANAKTAIDQVCKKRELSISECFMIDYRVSGGLSFEVRNPEALGSDRIANAVAAFNLIGGPVIVADLGTATTISVVDKTGNFLGGAIMPGMDMMRESLASRTAKLPSVTLSKPCNVTGRDTESAIASGIINGTAGAVEKIIVGIELETGMQFHLILTGGRAALISSHLGKKHIIIPDLIFEGLRLIYVRNAGHAGY